MQFMLEKYRKRYAENSRETIRRVDIHTMIQLGIVVQNPEDPSIPTGVKSGLVFVTAFLDKPAFRKFAADIAWDTEVWIADNPTHMIHFNGDRFFGPR